MKTYVKQTSLLSAEIGALECTRKSIINVNIASLCWRGYLYHKCGALRAGYRFVSIRRYHLVTEGGSAHNEESRQEPYRTNNRFESRSKDGILLMGSLALTVDRASFPQSSILSLSPSPYPSIPRDLSSFFVKIRTPQSFWLPIHTERIRQTSNSCTGDKSNAITRPPRELLRECL